MASIFPVVSFFELFSTVRKNESILLDATHAHNVIHQLNSSRKGQKERWIDTPLNDMVKKY
jgi:hypothetical protein